MPQFSPESQLQAYAVVRSLEARAQAVDELLGSLKRSCIRGGPGVVTELIAAAAELKWQLRRANELVAELDGNLGVQRGAEPAGERRREVRELGGIRGTTDVLAVPDLVNLLTSLAKTGTLALQAGEAMFAFEFLAGRIVHAITNQMSPSLRLGTILVAQNKLTEEQLAQGLDASAKAKEMLGAHLVQNATVSEADLRIALDTQVRGIFDAAFALPFARFTFVEGSLTNIAQRTAINTTQLLLEVARQKDEGARNGDRMSPARGALDSILK